jgi:TPR repeat protein
MLVLAMPKAKAGQEEGLSACEAGDWSTAARELAAEEATTTDEPVVRCLADMYLGGLGMRRDPAKAFQLWKKLADLGNDEAQDIVGYFYLDGVGTDRNPGRAEHSFIQSASQGNKNAMSELALYYSLGFIDCCPDEQKAMYWTQKLAALGDVYAGVAEKCRPRRFGISHLELFLYPGDQHYFADSSLPSYDAESAALLTGRVLAFLERI